MKKNCLSPAYTKRLARIRRALECGGAHHGKFGGKRLSSNRTLVSIPLGQRWRVVFEMTGSGYKYRDSMSHETYNQFIS